MYIESSDHACPHLREQRAAETRPAPAVPAPQAGCPFGRGAAEPLRLASASAGTGGWWAFAAQARAMTARA